MNQNQLIEITSMRSRIDKKTIQRVIKELGLTIKDVLNKGGEVKVFRVGKFYTKQTKERFVLNPITKRYCYCESKKRAVFKFFKNFKYCIK